MAVPRAAEKVGWVFAAATYFLLLSGHFLIAASESDLKPATHYQVIKRLTLGGEGAWDYVTIDSAARRLYISRSSHVMVMDLDSDKVIGDIPGTKGVHGIAIAPELNRGFTSNGDSNTSTIFDLKTLKVTGEVKTGAGPDGIIYDPTSKRVFTLNGDGQDATAFDAATGEVIGTIRLGGWPESGAADGQGKIYVNIVSTSEVVEIDAAKLVVTKRFSLAPGKKPSGLAIDAAHHLVFSGCSNKIMTVLDVTAGKVIASVPIGKWVDANGFDPGTGLAFSSNGEGTLTVAHETAAGKFEVENVKTEDNAQTMAVDLKTHNIYLPTARFEPARAAPGKPEEPDVMVKGSFMIVVVGK